MKKSEFSKSYAVRVKYGDFLGSGVLIKVDKKHCYLFTAKHNFKKNERDSLDSIIGDNIDIESVSLTRDNGEKLVLKEFIFDKDDFIVFLVDRDIKSLERSFKILTGEVTDKMKYFSYGYPSLKNDGHLFDNFSSYDEITTNKFEIKNRDKIDWDEVKGFSGSGVFIEDNENEARYLCGIILQSADSYHTITVFNLSSIIDTLNKKLKEKNYTTIPIKKSNFDLKKIDDVYDWIIKNQTKNFLVQQVENVFNKEYQYKELGKNLGSLKIINNFMHFNHNRFIELEVEYKQGLADMYLLATFLSAKYEGKNKPKAEKYFKKAVEYRKDYSIYLADLKKEDSKDVLFREAKLLYIDKKYLLAKQYFERIINFSFTDKELIEIYNYLLNIAKIDEDINTQIDISKKLLDLYTSDDKLEKAEICYELSFLVESEDKKIKSLNKASQYLTYGGESLEIEYKTLKQLVILRKDRKASLKKIELLEQLVLYKSQYQEDLYVLKNERYMKKLLKGASLLIFVGVGFILYKLKDWFLFM